MNLYQRSISNPSSFLAHDVAQFCHIAGHYMMAKHAIHIRDFSRTFYMSIIRKERNSG